MNTINVHLILFGKPYTQLHRTSFIKKKYLTEIAGILIN